MNLKEILLNEKRRNENPKEIFLKEKENCKGPFYHIMGDINDPALIEIDNLYAIADTLSMENARKHEKNLLYLSVLGPLLSIVFFIYFEGEIHSAILFCVILLFLLLFIQKKANKMDCHRKYLEYRVLAESIRVQFFLSMADIKVPAREIMPWFIQKGIPWIEDILKILPLDDVKEKHPIIYFWILDQKTYHEGALEIAEAKKRTEKIITKIAIIITALTYLTGLIFEAYMFFYSPNIDAHMIRIGLKMAIGSMSVGILFLESYYGKMSLSEKINDHKRMILLYAKVEKDIINYGEKKEIILDLAKEFLIENSTWYAYQSKNKAELVL